MNQPPACAASRASGDPALPTPTSGQPRPGCLPGGAQGLLRRSRAGHRDDKVLLADPARQPVVVQGDHLRGRARPADGGEHLTRHPGTAHPRDHDPARTTPGQRRAQVGLGGGPGRRAELGGRRIHLTEHAARICGFNHGQVV